ncbi:nucleotide exchange factor GrpE [Patescibacteria group bacterium]|nr:nucleotide exchange factor GrpE [Patescibacteria group bacterium]
MDEDLKDEQSEVSLDQLQDDLKLAQKKMEEYMNGWKRAKADYINLKKETDKKHQELIQFANAGLILEMLPIHDNFKRAWEHVPDNYKKGEEWLKGIEQIKKQFTELLKNMGIEEIRTVGEKFNPEVHEAVAKEKSEDIKSGRVIEEVKTGYKLYDKVLDHAKVKVAE